MNSLFEIPILLITFNRPNHTKKVFDEVKMQKPKRLYVFQDGCRDGNISDIEKCLAVKKNFSESINWNCELKTFYSNVNLGCGKGPQTAISWFFENEEYGIILEDDCLPHPDFFSYCKELLIKYKDINKVMFIGATTYHDLYPSVYSYFFTKHPVVGAWASWRRAWNGYDFDLFNLDAEILKDKLKKQLKSKAEIDWWIHRLNEMKNDKSKHYWDYQFHIHLYLNDGVAIMPRRNMISNIGFDSEGTHTKSNDDNRGYRQTYSCMPLIHPYQINVNKELEYRYLAKDYDLPFFRQIIKTIYEFANNSNGWLKKLLIIYKKEKKVWKHH